MKRPEYRKYSFRGRCHNRLLGSQLLSNISVSVLCTTLAMASEGETSINNEAFFNKTSLFSSIVHFLKDILN